MAHTKEPLGSGLALKTTCHSMIPMILLENNAGPHQSGPCVRWGGGGMRGGDNAAHTEPSRRERLPDGTALFTA